MRLWQTTATSPGDVGEASDTTTAVAFSPYTLVFEDAALDKQKAAADRANDSGRHATAGGLMSTPTPLPTGAPLGLLQPEGRLL